MESFEGFRKSGTFILAPGVEVQGDLILKGAATTLDLFAKDFFSTHALQDGCIQGALHDRTKVSLIDCITTQGLGSGSRGEEHYHFASVFPHFVIFGEAHITSADQKITEVSFHVDDATNLFHDLEAFGKVTDARPHMERVVEAKTRSGRDIVIGEHPMIFYYTGKHEIFRAETVFGAISATHLPSYTFPGPEGIKLDNKIHVNIAFKGNVTVAQAISNVTSLLCFLEIIAGRPQNVLRLILSVPGAEETPTLLNVYWSMPPSRDGNNKDRRPHPADLPIHAARTPDIFAAVLTAWLARDHEWRSARFRFSSAFSLQHQFTIDRLVGAANMFDILPASAVPADIPLTPEMEDAKTTSRALFKKLPPGPERESILNALGRLGKAALKHKVRSRNKLIFDRVPTLLLELNLVTDEAVNCRNYFVHGSKPKLGYNDEFGQVIFFTEALEFVFAASDLIECGWDIGAWAGQSSSVSHPFDRFRDNYAARLTDLKRALAAAKAAAG